MVLVLGLGVWLAARPLLRTSTPVFSPVGTPRAVLPPEFHPITLELGGQEVAPPWRRPEGEGGAALEEAVTPAPVASATHSQDTRVRTPRQAIQGDSQQQQQQQSTGSTATKSGTAILVCALATGCPGPTTTAVQVRPLPSPAQCPPDAVRTMKELGFRIGKSTGALFPQEDESEPFVPVREGPGTMMEIERTGTELPAGTMVSGELFFGADRIHGRFTQLHIPGGPTYPICMVLVNRSDRLGVGGQDVKQGEKPGTTLISYSEGLIPVERFE